MKSRIKDIINDEGLNSAQFAGEIGIAPSSLHHIISGRNNPSLDVIQKILLRYPQINAEWLINGKGKKYKNLVQGKLFDIPLEEDKIEDLNKLSESKSEEDIKEPDINTVNVPAKEIVTSLKDKTLDSIVFFYKDGSFKQYKNS